MDNNNQLSIRILTNHGGQSFSPTWKKVSTRIPSQGSDWFSSLKLAVSMYLRRNRYDCVVLGAGRSDYIFAILQSLIPFRRVKCLKLDCLWSENPNKTKHGIRKLNLYIISRSVDKFIVWANHEIKDFSKTFELPQNKFIFVPYHTTDAEFYQGSHTDEGYLFSGGNSHRDYSSLIDAVRGLHLKLFIATNNKINTIEAIPKNIDIRSYSPGDYLEKMAKSSINIVALAPNLLRSAGQQSFLNSMLLGKPTIVTDINGASDYIDNYIDGIIVPSGNTIALREAINFLVNNPDKAREMGDKARIKAKYYSTDEHFKKIIALASEISISRRNRP